MMLRKTCGCSRNSEPPEDVPVSGKNAPERSLGPCPSVNRHHWILKFKGRDQARDIRGVCHRMLHRTFSEIELAKNSASLDVLERIAIALGVDPKELCNERG